VPSIAEALGVPLIRRKITGKSVHTEMEYTENEQDEVEDLHALLQQVKL